MLSTVAIFDAYFKFLISHVVPPIRSWQYFNALKNECQSTIGTLLEFIYFAQIVGRTRT